jgi:hypothetical protein
MKSGHDVFIFKVETKKKSQVVSFSADGGRVECSSRSWIWPDQSTAAWKRAWPYSVLAEELRALRATRPHTVGYIGVCDQAQGAIQRPVKLFAHAARFTPPPRNTIAKRLAFQFHPKNLPPKLPPGSGPLRAIHLSRHKWPGGLLN